MCGDPDNRHDYLGERAEDQRESKTAAQTPPAAEQKKVEGISDTSVCTGTVRDC